MFSQVNVIPWLIKWSVYKGAEPWGRVQQRGSSTDNFDELTWFLPRQEGSQQGRWGLLPHNPTLESSHILKGWEHTCTEQHLQSKQPQSTGISHLHSGKPWIPQVFLTAFEIDALSISIKSIKANNDPTLLQYLITKRNLFPGCQR